MMTLSEFIHQLETIRDFGDATPDSPIILEGHDEDDNLVQAWIDGVSTERRCEADGEPQAVYLGLSELTIG